MEEIMSMVLHGCKLAKELEANQATMAAATASSQASLISRSCDEIVKTFLSVKERVDQQQGVFYHHHHHHDHLQILYSAAEIYPSLQEWLRYSLTQAMDLFHQTQTPFETALGGCGGGDSMEGCSSMLQPLKAAGRGGGQCTWRNDIFYNIKSLLHNACTKYQKRTIAVVFVLFEGISIILDVFGTSTWNFCLASFLISAFGVVMTLYTAFFMGKGNWKPLTSLEIVFSFTQLIVTYIDLVLKILRVKNINYNYKASAFPLVFSIIVLVIAFKTHNKINSPPTQPTTDANESGSTGQIHDMAVDSDLPGSDQNPWSDGLDGVSIDNLDNQDRLKKRKPVPSSTEKVRVSPPIPAGLGGAPGEGYNWRKYTQKDILGAEYSCWRKINRTVWLQY